MLFNVICNFQVGCRCVCVMGIVMKDGEVMFSLLVLGLLEELIQEVISHLNHSHN